jgi:ferritin-like metal-binding protein YciE
MLDQIRREIQDHLEELLGEIDRLRRALAALTSRLGRASVSTTLSKLAKAGGSLASCTMSARPLV